MDITICKLNYLRRKGKNPLMDGAFSNTPKATLTVTMELFPVENCGTEAYSISRVAFDTLPNARTNKPNEFNIIKSFVSEKDKIALAVTMRYAKDSVDLGTAENISRLTIHRKIFSDDK
eukprot:15177405-Ditylum_brightwellii.AAC.1